MIKFLKYVGVLAIIFFFLDNIGLLSYEINLIKKTIEKMYDFIVIFFGVIIRIIAVMFGVFLAFKVYSTKNKLFDY